MKNLFCKVCSGKLKVDTRDCGFDYDIAFLICVDCGAEDRVQKFEHDGFEYLPNTEEIAEEQYIEDMED